VVQDINALAVADSEVSSTLITIKSLEIVAEGEGGATADPAADPNATSTTAPAA
jgi:hypothetical protein